MANTVLLSYIGGGYGTTKVQIVIPNQLLNGAGGGLGIQLQCAAKSDQLSQSILMSYPRVDYANFANLKGPVNSYLSGSA